VVVGVVAAMVRVELAVEGVLVAIEPIQGLLPHLERRIPLLWVLVAQEGQAEVARGQESGDRLVATLFLIQLLLLVEVAVVVLVLILVD
jgi:hypothetical protein